jgi:hypothetical protein
VTKSVSETKDIVPPEVKENMKNVKHKIVVLSGKGKIKRVKAESSWRDFILQLVEKKEV